MNVKFDPFERTIAASYFDGTIKLFEVGSGKLKCVMNADLNPEYAVNNIRWRPGNSLGESDTLISVDVQGNIKSWNSEKGKERACVTLPDVQLSGLDYKPDGTQFVVAGSDKVPKLYDDTTMKMVTELDTFNSGHAGHSNRIFCAKFDPSDGNIVLTGGWDNTVIIHDLRQKGPVRGILGAVVLGDAIDI